MDLADRAEKIEPSPTLSLSAKANAMKKAGKDVVAFGVGEPDYNTPDHVKEAAIIAIEENFTRYTAASGIDELKEAVAEKFSRDNGLSYSPSQIIVSTGGKHCLFNAVMVLCEPGDEVILPAPYWVSYPEQIKFSGAKARVLRTDEETDFKLTPEMLRKAINANTKMLMFNTPNNPSGAVYSREELEALAEVILENDLYVVSDEIYEKLVYEGREHVSIAEFDPALKEKTVVVNGVSKAFAMTGWRIGFAVGPQEIIDAMGTLQGHTTSNATSISQKAALAAITGSQEMVGEMVATYERRRDYMWKVLNDIDGIYCHRPGGAFYLFPNIEGLIGREVAGTRIEDGDTFAEVVLEEAHVAVVPGSGFGCPHNVRFSYSNSMERIKEGLNRLTEIL